MWPAPLRAAAVKLCWTAACTLALRRGRPARAHRAARRSQASVRGPCISRAAPRLPLARDAPDDGAVFVQRVAQLHPRLARCGGRGTRAETPPPARRAHAVGRLRRLGPIGLRVRHPARDPRPAPRAPRARERRRALGWRCADRWVNWQNCQLRARAPAPLHCVTLGLRCRAAAAPLRHGHRAAIRLRDALAGHATRRSLVLPVQPRPASQAALQRLTQQA